MRSHLKRINMPKSWPILRKENTFVIRPRPSGHSFNLGLSLLYVLKFIGVAATLREARFILNNQDVLVNGIKKKEEKQLVGFMDVITLPLLNEAYVLLINKKGKLFVSKLDSSMSDVKLSKVSGRTHLKGGKIQLNFFDGLNILSDAKVSVGDVCEISLKDKSIKHTNEFKVGADCIFMGGKLVGKVANIVKIIGNEIFVTIDGKEFESKKQYAFTLSKSYVKFLKN